MEVDVLRVLFLTVLALEITAHRAYAVDCGMSTRLDAMTIGTLAFASVQDPKYTVEGQELVNNDLFCRFDYSGSFATFRLLGALNGAVQNLSIKGRRILPGGAKNKLTVPAGLLRFDLTLSKPVNIKLLGGTIALAAGTPLHVVNDTPISIDGDRVTGTLSYQTTELTWSKASARLPFGFPALSFSPRSVGDVRLRSAIADGRTQVTEGVFLAPTLSAHKVEAHTEMQRSRVRKASAEQFRFHVNLSQVTIEATNVEIDGATVVKATPTLAIPLLADGRLRARLFSVTVAASPAVQDLPRFDLHDVHYAPAHTAKAGRFSADASGLAKELGVRTLDDDQEAAIGDGVRTLREQGHFNCFIALTAEDVLSPIEHMLESTRVFSTIEASLRPQQILAGGQVTSGPFSVHAVLKVAPSIVDQSLKLRASIEFVEPSEANLKRVTSDSLMTEMASTDNVSAASFELARADVVLPLDLPVIAIDDIDQHGTLNNQINYTVRAKSTHINMRAITGALLVHPGGLRVLASLVTP